MARKLIPGGVYLNDTTDGPGLIPGSAYLSGVGSAPEPGLPPSGTVTIGTITPSTTSASVPYSYSAADQTGFEYRLNGGTAASIGASPATISGLTAGTPYSIEVRAINAAGAGAWSAVSNFTTSAAADITAPTLTGPSASATGTTTASGSVSTNEANGTLYYLASANASESAATVKAGLPQAVTASGMQNVSITGLTASTSYYLHFVHRDAAGNDSAVASSAQFTTSAAGDTTPPTLTGAVTFASITQTGYTASWPAESG